MQAQILHKIPQGKLVRLYLHFDTTTLESIRICGDFFIHPEETVLDMERVLTRIPIECGPARVKSMLDRVVEKNNAQLIGVDTENLARLICGAINP